MTNRVRRGPIIAAGTLLGAGLGGFLDGIVLHQILQWHNMLSSVVQPDTLVTMKYNMLFDGLFHAMTWLMTVAGLGVLWQSGRKPEVPWSPRTFVGSLALGWGLFNFVEGLINHQILELHHVHPGANQLAWDVGFLLSGVLLIGCGSWSMRSAQRERA
jgi:uncharacterized membrane protein